MLSLTAWAPFFIMSNSYYFQHDFNSIQDPKMMTLLSECGLAGVGMFWIIIEILHQQESGSITIEEFRRYLQFYFHYQSDEDEELPQKLEEVFNNTKLLEIKDGIVTSKRVLENLQFKEKNRLQKVEAGRLGGIISGKKRSKTKQRFAESEATVEANEAYHIISNHIKLNDIKEKKEPISFSFQEVSNAYPNKVGMKEAERHFKTSVKTQEDFELINQALKNYLTSERVKKGFIQNASTWFNNWRDWIKPPISQGNDIPESMKKWLPKEEGGYR